MCHVLEAFLAAALAQDVINSYLQADTGSTVMT